MSVTGKAGTVITVGVTGMPPGLLGTITLSIEDSDGALIMAPRATQIIESPVASGNYRSKVLLPAEPVDAMIVWDPHTGDPTDITTEDLLVVPADSFLPGSGDVPWAPSPDDVAQVLPTYTRGGFDDDAYQAGAELGRFTDETSPTLAHVEALIDIACAEIEGRVGLAQIPERCWKLARSTAIWHVAAAVSKGKLPAETDEATAEQRTHAAAYLSSLEELVSQARQPTALRIT